MSPKLEHIDHVHINVSNRAASEIWYRDYLGFVRDSAFEPWVTDKPLTISNNEKSIHLALFEREDI